jgi:hypothetical protein
VTNGLLDPRIVAFVFTPVLVSAATVVTLLLRQASRDVDRGRDVPASLLAWAICAMPAARKEWGLAMVGELAAVPGGMARWRFALSCARAALFLPSGGPGPGGERRPMFGLFAVTAPPLALPFIYVAAVVIEAAGPAPAVIVRMLVVSTLAALVAGVPLGLASRWRQESLPQLTTWGIASSVGTSAYFLLAMRWLAGGD